MGFEDKGLGRRLSGTRFYRWALTQTERQDPVGDGARFIRDWDRSPIFQETEDIQRIGSDLFGRRVSGHDRRLVRKVHRAWKHSLLVAKFGEWPIGSGQ